MSKLLFQDEVLDGMDVYVEFTFDEDEVILYDYGLELDAEVPINGVNGREVVDYRTHVSLRGYKNTRWMEDRLIEFILDEYRTGDDE